MSNILQALSAKQETMQSWLHHLHRYPEVAFEEVRTASYIADLLRSWGYEVTEGIGKTGVVAKMKLGDGASSIGLRADIDALGMQEGTDCEHKSTIDGKMHGCGHDAHTTMLLGAAQYLAETKSFNGTLNLIFQPAEEIMAGAIAMINDGLFEKFPMQRMFGLHNMPALEKGKIHLTEGGFMAAVDNWEIELTGKGSHGSMPENSIDPVVAGASLVMALQTIVSRNIAAKNTVVVSVGAFLAGDAANGIPQKAILRMSVRTSKPEIRQYVLDRIRAITAAQSACYGVSYEIREGVPGAVLVNDPELTAQTAQVVRDALGEDSVITPGPTYMGSEDFAYYAQKVQSTYALIGNGDTAMVHNPAFKFDESNLPIGASYWVAIAQHFLK